MGQAGRGKQRPCGWLGGLCRHKLGRGLCHPRLASVPSKEGQDEEGFFASLLDTVQLPHNGLTTTLARNMFKPQLTSALSHSWPDEEERSW